MAERSDKWQQGDGSAYLEWQSEYWNLNLEDVDVPEAADGAPQRSLGKASRLRAWFGAHLWDRGRTSPAFPTCTILTARCQDIEPIWFVNPRQIGVELLRRERGSP